MVVDKYELFGLLIILALSLVFFAVGFIVGRVFGKKAKKKICINTAIKKQKNKE